VGRSPVDVANQEKVMTVPVHAPPPSASSEDRPAAATRRGGLLRLAGAVAVAVSGFVWVLPRVTGAAWSGIGSVLAGVRPSELALLTALWAAGLLAYSFVLTGALPGLTRVRALTLNLTGSAVSNVAPMGGAFGVAANLMMVRAWRFRPSAFAAYTVVTNLWDVLGKLVLLLVALAVAVTGGTVAGSMVQAVALTTSLALLALLGLIVVVLRSERVARGVGRVGVVVLQRVAPGRAADRAQDLESALLDTRTRVRVLVERAWPQLTTGTVGYLSLQGVLLWACLHVVGAAPSFSVVVAGFAVERLLSLAVITPGGAGLAEAGSAGVLVALGVDPVLAAAGIVLYRAFTFLLEIPVGGLWLGGWVVARRGLRAAA
jgi:uncharacterized protein (TIRG00374 family)